MPGPAPKDPSLRARRNKASTRSTLNGDHDIKAPPLPAGVKWHKNTRAWWRDAWASPMAPEYTDTDRHGLYQVAMLNNDFWTAATPKERAECRVRLEKAEADFGMNPLARRRLEWQIEETQDKQARGRRRQVPPAADVSPPPGAAEDPRLRLVASSD